MKRPTKAERLEEAAALNRFVARVLNSDAWRELGLDDAALQATVAAVQARMAVLNAHTGPKSRARYTLDTAQFGVALARARGELRYTDAVNHIMRLSSCNYRTAQKHLAEMKPRAEKTAAFLAGLKAHAIPAQ